MSAEDRDDAAAEGWVDDNSGRIAVRVQVDGRWQSLFIAELPEPLRSYWRGRMVERWQHGARQIIRLVGPAEEPPR